MSFYEELSKYYDIVFPVNDGMVKFIKDRVPDKSVLLDVACGTGGLALSLAREGHKVDGIDMDSKMIEIAAKKAEKENLSASFKVGDMRNIDTYFDDKYSLITCTGNSIVHLDNIEEIEDLISKFKLKLRDKGKVIIQIINYDRILKYQIDSLPTIEREEEGVKFVRKYKYSEYENKIFFNTELIVTQKGISKSFTNSVRLLPLQSDALLSAFKKAGFKNLNIYGDFKGSKHDDKSYATIITAEN